VSSARTFDKGVSAAAPSQPLPPFAGEHQELRASIRGFIARELRPHATEWEDARWFPDEVFTTLAGNGFLGLKYPEAYGGEGGDHLHDAIFTEELAGCGSGGLAAGIGAHIGIATPPVFKFGTEDQKQRFLVPAIRGDRIAALGITEPGAGSDVAGIRTKAQRVDGGFIVNGSKTFITNGVRADFVVTAVKTTQEGGHQGLSFLIVERGMEGFSVSKKLEKMGWHASDTAELAFQDVFVPDENLLGTEHKGFYLIMANFQWERLLMALGAVGSMHRMLEATVSFALERSAFGREIGPREERSPIVDRASTAPRLSLGRAPDRDPHPRRSAIASPRWRSSSRRAARSPTTRCASSTRATMPRARSPRPSSRPSAPPSRSPTQRCRSTGARAT
jgi:acyl-CoA dehydrogenase